MKAINPATGELIKTYKRHDQEALNSILSTTQSAWEAWRKTSFEHRSKLMLNAAQVLRKILKNMPFS